MNKIIEPGGKPLYVRGNISLRSHDTFIGLWRMSKEESEEGDRYDAHTLIETYDSYSKEEAIEAAVTLARK